MSINSFFNTVFLDTGYSRNLNLCEVEPEAHNIIPLAFKHMYCKTDCESANIQDSHPGSKITYIQ
jgi:hypothetical protein